MENLRMTVQFREKEYQIARWSGQFVGDSRAAVGAEGEHGLLAVVRRPPIADLVLEVEF